MTKFSSIRTFFWAAGVLAGALSQPSTEAGEFEEPVWEAPKGPMCHLPVPPAPYDDWALDFETSLLWRVTNTTPLNYTVLAESISLRSPQHIKIELGAGDLVVRANFTVLAEAFLEGAESYYLGFSGSPSIEYWFPSRRTHLYFSAGGGVGWVDSTDIEGGQGQDFTFNWFVKSGIRHQITESVAVSAGVHFQHLSNRGMADRNPGLDALGPAIGLSVTF